MKGFFKTVCCLCFATTLHAGAALFSIQLALGEPSFPSEMGWYDSPVTRFVSVTNQTGVTMPVTYILPPQYHVNSEQSTCGSTLAQGASCQLAVVFNPDRLGRFAGQLKVCGHNGLWCSVDPVGFNTTVKNNDIVSKQCSTIQSRPFAAQDCSGSYVYANNLYSFMSRVLNVSESTADQHFQYFQHTPSTNETTTPCLQAHQVGVGLDPLIEGGGAPLCDLMGYATSNSGANASISKLFPPYLTMLLGTAYPIESNTTVLQRLPELMATFALPVMDPSVQHLGYNGYVDFLNSYYLQQTVTPYADCGTSAVCPALYYLPYATNSTQLLQTWPPAGINYWGMSGGGGSGAGYQIEAFKPKSATHYVLFSGGGGGGGGNTTPENTPPSVINLISTGSGGGGGSQFANCFVTNEGNFNGLGLGAGTGSGLNVIEGHDVSYQAPPATDYSFYPPNTHPSWDHNTTLTSYGNNLYYLFHTLIPQLYNSGYTIAVTGGGGGGAGLEFLNSAGAEYQPHPVSIGYGFNFCFVFNKAQQHTATDCISSPNAGSPRAITLDNLIYKNIGNFFTQGMTLAVSTCAGGYSNYQCTCSFQHAYVICKLTELLVANGFSSADIPTWLVNPHCNESSSTLVSHASLIEQLSSHTAPSNCVKSIQNFYQQQTSTACVPPWS